MLLGKYFGLVKKSTFFLILLLPIAAFVEISVSYLLQIITDSVSGHNSISYGVLVTIVVAYMIIDALLYFLSSYFEQTILNRIMAKLHMKLLDSLFRQRTGLGKDVQKTATNFYNDFTNTLDILRSDYLQGTINAYKQLCQFIIAMIISLLIQPVFSVIIVLLCLPALLVPFLQRKILKDNKKRVLGAGKQYTNSLQNAINGIRTIQIFSIQHQVRNIFRKDNDRLLTTQNKDQLKRKQVGGVSQLLDNILYLGTWVVGIYFVMKKSVTLGQLVSFSQLMIFIAEPIQSASGLLSDIVGGKEAAIKIQALTLAKHPKSGKKSFGKFRKIAYINTSFTDKAQVVLADINLELDKGKHYLIVGKSGSGKSSLINAPFSNAADQQGQITLNDENISSFRADSIFPEVGLLEQNSFVFNASIRHNLTLFTTEFSDEKLINILKEVGLNDYATPEGLDTVVTDSGTNLSGGEKKRLTLGRLLLRNCTFTFFDEPLSGLDPHTAQDIIKRIMASFKNKGWALVTHQYDERLFSGVDEIIFVSQARIVAKGNINDPKVQRHLALLGFQ